MTNSKWTKEAKQEGIGLVISSLVLFLFIIAMSYDWSSVKAFFSSNIQVKCESTIDSNDNDTYCKEDGAKGSRLVDLKEDCQNKAPHFQWKENGRFSTECRRVSYPSKSECIEDGKQGSKRNDEGGVWYTECLQDGSWISYDPENRDFLTNPDNVSCVDVTSFDYNWENDMLCTSPDGKTFYTSYEGAKAYR